MDKLTRASTSVHCNSFCSLEKGRFTGSSIPATARPSRQLRRANFHLCYCQFSQGLQNSRVLLQKKKRLRIHALPLSTVTTDHDSEGSTPESSTECKGILSDQDVMRTFLINTEDWYARARNQAVIAAFIQALKKLNTVVRSMERIWLPKDIKRSRLAMFGMHSWRSMQLWIKLPIAIFLPWFLFISAFYGTSASMDLLPFWIIGPLMVSISVRTGMKLSALCRKWAAEMKVKERALSVMQGFKTGQLPGRLVQVFTLWCMDLKNRTVDGVLFVFHGGIILVLRRYMYRKLLEQQEIWADRWEDWRLVYLRLERTLKNII